MWEKDSLPILIMLPARFVCMIIRRILALLPGCIGRLFRWSSKPMRRFPKIRSRLFLGREETVGRNSRQMLTDGSIYWIGRREFVRPTGPFDSQLPVMGFRSKGSAKDPAPWKALWFNHSTHTIGTFRSGVRSPIFLWFGSTATGGGFGHTCCFWKGHRVPRTIWIYLVRRQPIEWSMPCRAP